MCLESLVEYVKSRPELEGLIFNEKFEGLRLADKCNEFPLEVRQGEEEEE